MLIFKIFGGLAGAAAVAVPVSMGATATYKEVTLIDLQRKIEDLKNRCYVIPTDNTDTNVQEKLLICESKHTYSSSYSQYLLLQGQEVRGEEENAIEEIKKSDDQLMVSWKEWEMISDSHSLNTKSTNLKINGDEWDNIKKDVDLKSACHFLSNNTENGGPQWQCNGVSSGDGGEIKISLTKFLG